MQSGRSTRPSNPASGCAVRCERTRAALSSFSSLWFLAFVGLLLIVPACLLPLSQVRADPVANDARLGGDLRKTRFVADLSKAVDFRVFTLSNPYRVVIDLPEVNFQMPPELGTKGRGLVSAFRYGLFSPGKSRIVIDVVKPVKIDKAFLREAGNGKPARLVIDMVAITAENFKKISDSSAITVGTPPERTKPRADTDRPRKTKPGARQGNPVIVLDPGHGGIDPGAIGSNGTTEKAVVLAFARQLKRELAELGGFDVFLTRDSDVFIPLAERVDIAHHHGADLFISIHADALPKKYADVVRGATIYTLSEEASDEQARALAEKENSADLIAGMSLDDRQDDVNAILLDLMRRETNKNSISFSRTMLTKLKGRVVLNKKAVRSADFRVLRAPDIPSVLLEMGYLTNSKDEKLLVSETWRARLAVQVARAVEAFFNKREVRLPF